MLSYNFKILVNFIKTYCCSYFSGKISIFSNILISGFDKSISMFSSKCLLYSTEIKILECTG